MEQSKTNGDTPPETGGSAAPDAAAPPPPPPPSAPPPPGGGESTWGSSTGSSPGGSGGSGTGNAQVDQVLEQVRRLRRSRNDRVVAGVCGGLGRSLGVDPVLLRVVLAVLVLFAGAGILLYALAWLLLPVDDGTPSLGAQIVDRKHQAGGPPWLAIVLTVVVGIGLLSGLERWNGPWLVALVVVALVVWLLRRSADHSTAGTTPPPSAGPGSTASYPAASHSTYSSTYSSGGHSEPAAYGAAYTAPSEPAVPPGAPASFMPAPTGFAPTAAPAPPAPPRPRSHLFGMIFSLTLIAMGLLAGADLAGADVPAAGYVALAVAMAGLGLLVGTWFGRARGLIAWGLVLALVLPVVSVMGAVTDGPRRSVNARYMISSTADLPLDSSYTAGRVEYAMQGLTLDGRSGSLKSHMGFGAIVVVVPQDVDVNVKAHVAFGEMYLFGAHHEGTRTTRTLTSVGTDGPGGGTLNLDLYVGFGKLEVRREAS